MTQFILQILQLLFVKKKKQLNKYLKKYKYYDKEKGCDGKVYAFTNKDGIIEHIVWVKRFNWTILDQMILTHELLHLVFAIMRYVDIRISRDSEEAVVYYFSMLFVQIYNKLKPKKKGKNAKKS